MRILLVTDSYPPEIRSASHLMLELAEELLVLGHQVTVITTWPQYNLDDDQTTSEFDTFALENGIQVLRLRTLPHHKVNYLIRGLAELLMPVHFIWALFRHRQNKHDAVIVYSPPLPLAFVGSWYRFWGARYVLNVQDLFPQTAIDLGVLRNRLLIGLFRALEGFAYATADAVTFHSENNRNVIVQHRPRICERTHVVYNWVDVEHHAADGPAVDYREKFQIDRPFVAVFAGVIGLPQYLDLIIEIAAQMRECKDLVFLIVGDGSEKSRLQELADQKQLDNVEFRPFVSREEYPDLLRICHVGLICLSPKCETPVVPGKILGYMAAALPCVALLHKQSDGHAIIADAKCGYSAYSDNFDESLEVMRRIYDERADLAEMGEAGRQYAREYFSKQSCVSQIEALLERA